MVLYIGGHLSIAGKSIVRLIKDMISIDGSTLQFFIRTPKSITMKTIFDRTSQSDIDEIKQLVKIHNFPLIVHGSYMTNLCKVQSQQPQKYLDLVIDDINKLSSINGIGVVMHPGSKRDLRKPQYQKTLISNITSILKSITNGSAKLVIETMATPISYGSAFEELQYIYQHIDKSLKPRLGFCFDTAHVWAYGYDLSTIEKAYNVLIEFTKAIGGIGNFTCIHLNSNPSICGSHIDRHADFDKGTIPSEVLVYITAFAQHFSIPIILERTHKSLTKYKDEIKRMKHDLKMKLNE